MNNQAEEIGTGIFRVYYGQMELGIFNEKTKRIYEIDDFNLWYWLLCRVFCSAPLLALYKGMVPANQFLSLYLRNPLHSNASGFMWALNLFCVFCRMPPVGLAVYDLIMGSSVGSAGGRQKFDSSGNSKRI